MFFLIWSHLDPKLDPFSNHFGATEARPADLLFGRIQNIIGSLGAPGRTKKSLRWGKFHSIFLLLGFRWGI